MLEGEATLLLQATGRVDSDRDVLPTILALGVCFDVLEVPNSPGRQL
jgi:hypothetical protein